MSSKEFFSAIRKLSKAESSVHLFITLGSGGIGTWFTINFVRNFAWLYKKDKKALLKDSIIDFKIKSIPGDGEEVEQMFLVFSIFDDDTFEFHNFNRLPLNAASFGQPKPYVALNKAEEITKLIDESDIYDFMSIIPFGERAQPKQLKEEIYWLLKANPKNRITIVNTTDSPLFHCQLVKELISDEAIKSNMNVLFVDIHYDGMLVSEGYFRPIEEARVLLPWSGTCEGVPGYTQASSHPAPPYYISESAFQRILQAWRMPDKRIKWIENKELDALIL